MKDASVTDLVSLENLGRGGCIERFDDELKRVIANILDPNTANGTRSITLTVKMKPDEKRTFCLVQVICNSRVQPAKAFDTQIFVGNDAVLGPVATEHNPEQMGLNLKRPENVVELGKAAEGGGKE